MCELKELTLEEAQLVLLRRLVEDALMESVAVLHRETEVAYDGRTPDDEQERLASFYCRVRALLLSALAGLYRELACEERPEAEEGSETVGEELPID